MNVQKQAYYFVGRKKLIIMSLATLGVFTAYWCYRNWMVIKNNENLDIWPIARAVFSPVFAYSLAKHLGEQYEQHDKLMKFPPIHIGIGYFAASFCYGIFTFIFAGMMQDAALELNELNELEPEDNTKITHWIFSLLYLYIVLSIVGISIHFIEYYWNNL